MARSASNVILRGFSGSLGRDLIVKQYKDGRDVISKRREFKKNRKKSDMQKMKYYFLLKIVRDLPFNSRKLCIS